MNAFPNGTLVDVRPSEANEWRAGVVEAYSHAIGWTVALDVPITQEEWNGIPSRYAPAGTIERAVISCAGNCVVPGQLIRLRP